MGAHAAEAVEEPPQPSVGGGGAQVGLAGVGEVVEEAVEAGDQAIDVADDQPGGARLGAAIVDDEGVDQQLAGVVLENLPAAIRANVDRNLATHAR
jgi:hypothetical protein